MTVQINVNEIIIRKRNIIQVFHYWPILVYRQRPFLFETETKYIPYVWDSLVHIIEGKEVHQDYYSFISSQIDYSLIVNLVRALNVDEPEFIMEYLIHYDPSINEAQSSEFYKQLVQKAILYNQNVFRAAAMASDINTSFDPHLELLLAKLKEFQDAVNPDDVQTACFSVAKENDLEFKEWFTYIYQVLLGQDSGPKLGPFICLYGIEATVNKINEYLTGRGD